MAWNLKRPHIHTHTHSLFMCWFIASFIPSVGFVCLFVCHLNFANSRAPTMSQWACKINGNVLGFTLRPIFETVTKAKNSPFSSRKYIYICRLPIRALASASNIGMFRWFYLHFMQTFSTTKNEWKTELKVFNAFILIKIKIKASLLCFASVFSCLMALIETSARCTEIYLHRSISNGVFGKSWHSMAVEIGTFSQFQCKHKWMNCV